MLMIRLSAEQVEELFQKAQSAEGLTLAVDLEKQELSDGKGWSTNFDVDPFRRKCLLEGLDDIGLTLAHEPEISAYEARR
jgi:3-isopropylmalate/(R)-2-methylmalate dehydratase small subunit